MSTTDIERRALKGGAAAAIDPLAVRLDEASRISGISRSGLYRLAARRELVFLKAGSRILVDMASLRAVVAALPRATINIAA
jgi:hypothetical protein